jgi:histidinol-phosphate aminotransferase
MGMDLDNLAKPFLKDLKPYSPGKPIEQVMRERGITEPPIKLASNENPYPPYKKIRNALVAAIDDINRYPESGAPELSEGIARLWGIDQDEVFVGNGTNEIIDLLIRAYVDPGENTVFSSLSFAIYKLVSMQCGVTGIEVPCVDFKHDLAAMAAAVTPKTKIVFVCNPNNPTGTYNTADELVGFVEAVRDDVLVVVDQAYLEYVTRDDYPDVVELRKKYPNIISLRTFSKVYSLAGLRIGYAIADKKVVGILNKMRQPFNVNRLAQVAAEAALRCRDELAEYTAENARERERVRGELLALGCDCPPTQTNFVFVIVNGYEGNVCGELENFGIIVRPMGQFGGAGNSFRVNMGTPEENNRFLAGFKKVLGRE